MLKVVARGSNEAWRVDVGWLVVAVTAVGSGGTAMAEKFEAAVINGGNCSGGPPWRQETGYWCFVLLRGWYWLAAWRTAGAEPSKMRVALVVLLGNVSVRGSLLIQRRGIGSCKRRW